MKPLDLSPLVSEIEQETTVVSGFETFVDAAVTQLEQHKDDPAAVQAVADQFKALRDRLGAALVKGTAAVTEAPPVVVDPGGTGGGEPPVVVDGGGEPPVVVDGGGEPPVVVDPGTTDPGTTDPGSRRR